MDSKIMNAMNKLTKKFRYEAAKIDAFNPSVECNTTFLKMYTKAYDYWVIYRMLPEGNCYKTHYLCLLCDILAEMGEVM